MERVGWGCHCGKATSWVCFMTISAFGISFRSPGEGNGNPPQYSYLENPHGQRSLTGYSPWGRRELDTTEQQQPPCRDLPGDSLSSFSFLLHFLSLVHPFYG